MKMIDAVVCGWRGVRATFVRAKVAPHLAPAFGFALGAFLALAPYVAHSQSSVIATPLPNAKQTFVDSNGKPYSGGKVYHYVPNTSTAKTTWSDTGETTPNANPVTLDSAGRATIFGQGNYRQVLKDANGNTVWDSFTTAVGSATPAGGAGTDTAPVGTVMPYSGFTVPTNWVLAYGQAISRSTYAELLTAITISNTTTSCTNSSTSLTGLSDTSQMRVGSPIEASCLPTGTTISGIPTSTTLTVSNAATSTGTVTSVVFPWGNGDGTLTFNVPDLRGRTFAGADAMGGTAASRLTSTYFGASASAPAVSGGAESKTLAQTNLPNVNFTVSGITAHISNPLIQVSATGPTAGNGIPQGSNASSGPNVSNAWTGTVTFDTQGTAASGGSGTAFAIIQPTLTINYIIKIAPNTSGAGGVTSLGGLFGDIICGTNVFCGDVAGVPTIQFTGSGSGSVSSVGLSAPAELSVSGSPITSFGTLALTWANQNANLVFAGPSSGVPNVPSFRTLVGADFGAQAQNTFLSGPTSGVAASPTFRAMVLGDIPSTLNRNVSACGYRANMASSPLSTSPTLRKWLIGPAFLIACDANTWNQATSPSGGSVWANSAAVWLSNVGQGGRGSFLQSLIDVQTYAGNGCSGITCVSSAGTYATVTFTNASPTVVTWTAHGLTAGRTVTFCPGDSDFYGPDCRYASPGTLPTGITANTVYYVCATGIATNTFSMSATYANAIAGTCNINTSSTGSGTLKGNNGRMGGFDPDVGTPTLSTVYKVFIVARNDGAGANDWGLLWSSGNCTAAGPGSTVRAAYPYWTCIDWVTTNGAGPPTAWLYQTMKNNYDWRMAGGTGTGGAGTASLIQLATGVQAQWTGIDPGGAGLLLDGETGQFQIVATVSTNAEFARVANNVHFGNYIPCGAVGVGGVGASVQCDILPDEGQIALWSNSLSTFFYISGGKSGF